MNLLPRPRPPPQKKNNNKNFITIFFQFLIGITVAAREIEDNSYAKCWWVNMGNYCLGSLLDSSDHWRTGEIVVFSEWLKKTWIMGTWNWASFPSKYHWNPTFNSSHLFFSGSQMSFTILRQCNKIQKASRDMSLVTYFKDDVMCRS